MNRKIVLLPITLLLYSTIFCQLTIVVKDAETKEPLPYATIECMNMHWGQYSDSAGYVTILDSIWKTNEIDINYMGYAHKRLRLNPQILEVLLTKIEKKLEDVVVVPCKEYSEAKIGLRNKKKNFGFSFSEKSNGFMWATLLPNNTKKYGFIKNISFCAKNDINGINIHAPVRIRFFEMDTTTGLPGNEITTENIILIPKKAGWQTHDINEFKISVPENGVVVAFDILNAGPQYRYSYNVTMTDGTKKTIQGYGWTLCGIKGDGVLGFTRLPGGGWRHFENLGNTPAAPQVELVLTVCKD